MALSPELIEVLRCPASREKLVYFAAGESGDDPSSAFLFSPAAGLKYRIEDEIPVLLVDEAERLEPAETERLRARAAELGLA
jgi:uncharacterized protein YbaR (Trm112 family)